jgi:hypothetical protein
MIETISRRQGKGRVESLALAVQYRMPRLMKTFAN